MHSYANRSLVNCGGSIAMPVKPASAARAATKRGVDPLKGSCSRNLPLPMESSATIMRCRRGRTIHGRGDPVDDWFRIISGMATKSMLMADGRRQIVDFLLPGDFFGFSARGIRAFDVEVISEDTVVARYPRRLVEPLIELQP